MMRLVPKKIATSFLAASAAVVLSFAGAPANATPANRVGLSKYYGTFLVKQLDNCNTCHQPLQAGKKPDSLADFPHNAFGARLKQLGDVLRASGKKSDIAVRLEMVAREDSDGDGVDNLTEILLKRSPGDAASKPAATEIAQAAALRTQFAAYLRSYRWQPFDPVRRPAVPKVKNAAWARNPIDTFLAAEHEARGLKPRPPASKATLLRRVYVDLVGLVPTPEEIRQFEGDRSPNAYEKVVDRLLASPRYGERWGRHWMDVWRYSDWAGWGEQVRDSKPHIWRWRDWIVESLNADKGYDRMAQEMLAADELCPEDESAQRATGFLVRNFKLLSREQWMEDVVGHTSKAFLGVTMHCAKCHDHMYDPISQAEYYRLRAVFEPHNVRTDRVPGQPDINKDGLVHAFDADPKAVTYFYPRGDERNPDKERVMTPGIPAALGGELKITPIKLPVTVVHPERRDFEVKEALSAADQAVEAARKAVSDAADGEKKALAEARLRGAEARREALKATIQAERQEDSGAKGTEEWARAAGAAVVAQRKSAAADAEANLLTLVRQTADLKAKAETEPGDKTRTAYEEGKKRLAEAEKALSVAQEQVKAPPGTAFKPRSDTVYPAESTGRRLAFARWLTDASNPLTARVAVNQIWMRHFGTGIVPSVSDFGRNGRAPSNPRLLDWLAAELMANGWKMKPLHRLIVTSSAYRMASTPDPVCAKIDPDDNYLWRMPSRRMEAEAVRDNVLYISGSLDETMGGPEVDHNQGMASRRRSLYLRTAAEKEVEFLKIFDNASVTECYERKQSVMPQQALALANSELCVREAHTLVGRIVKPAIDDSAFIDEAFLRVLNRSATAQEKKLCLEFLQKRSAPSGAVTVSSGAPAPSVLKARESLLLVLFNHNDFVTVR